MKLYKVHGVKFQTGSIDQFCFIPHFSHKIHVFNFYLAFTIRSEHRQKPFSSMQHNRIIILIFLAMALFLFQMIILHFSHDQLV